MRYQLTTDQGMFRPLATALFVIGTLFLPTVADTTKALFIFKDPAISDNSAIKSVGFNTVIAFALNLQDNGDIVYPLSALGGGSPDVLLVSNGTYVGGSKYADLLKNYKVASTIDRVEATFGPYDKIRTFIQNEGTGASSTLYKNLAALRRAWKLDAINNDDEATYDLDSTVSFAKMVGSIGYKYSAAPYTNMDFWASTVKAISAAMPGLFDRVYLQCYDGGAGNDPVQWQSALGLPMTPIFWVTNDAKPVYGMTPAHAQSQFREYKHQGISGGGYWNNYDIEKLGSSYTAYEEALEKAFG